MVLEEIIPQLNVYDSLDNKEHVLGIYSDLKKAFDTVDHSILLWKLNNYGIRGVVHDWFASYLSNRLQFTAVNGCSSCKLPVTCGIPQGSVLGLYCFLFILMITIFQGVKPNYLLMTLTYCCQLKP